KIDYITSQGEKLMQKPKERTLIGPAEALPTRARSSREIILERRARSNRNGGRHHRGFADNFPRNPHRRKPAICATSTMSAISAENLPPRVRQHASFSSIIAVW